LIVPDANAAGLRIFLRINTCLLERPHFYILTYQICMFKLKAMFYFFGLETYFWKLSNQINIALVIWGSISFYQKCW